MLAHELNYYCNLPKDLLNIIHSYIIDTPEMKSYNKVVEQLNVTFGAIRKYVEKKDYFSNTTFIKRTRHIYIKNDYPLKAVIERFKVTLFKEQKERSIDIFVIIMLERFIDKKDHIERKGFMNGIFKFIGGYKYKNINYNFKEYMHKYYVPKHVYLPYDIKKQGYEYDTQHRKYPKYSIGYFRDMDKKLVRCKYQF